MINAEDMQPQIDYDKLGALRPNARPYDSYLAPGFQKAEMSDAYAYEEPARPTGITIMAALNFLAAGLFALAVLIFLGGQEGSAGQAMLALVEMAASIAIGIGLLQLKRWAYWLALVGYGLSALNGLVSIFSDPGASGLLQLVIAGCFLYYLSRQNVRDAFEL